MDEVTSSGEQNGSVGLDHSEEPNVHLYRLQFGHPLLSRSSNFPYAFGTPTAGYAGLDNSENCFLEPIFRTECELKCTRALTRANLFCFLAGGDGRDHAGLDHLQPTRPCSQGQFGQFAFASGQLVPVVAFRWSSSTPLERLWRPVTWPPVKRLQDSLRE